MPAFAPARPLRPRRAVGAPWGMAAALSCPLLVAAAACTPEVRLVAVRGCGLSGGIDRLRVAARGDFAASPVFVDDDATLPGLPEGARALTVEGLSGDDPVAAGRTGPLDGSAGELPVYYARGDGICAVPSGVTTRLDGAAGSTGAAAVYAGGIDTSGGWLDEVVVARREHAHAEVVARLPIPVAGAFVVPEADDAVWVGGGIGPAGVVGSAVRVDLASGDVSDPVSLWYAGGPLRIGYGAAVPLPDGGVFVAGGCSVALGAACDPAALRAETWVFRAAERQLAWQAGPVLPQGRIGLSAAVSAGGVVFVAGGRDAAGEPLTDVLRLDGDRFEPFGPSLDGLLEAGEAVAGLAALDPGTVVLSTDAGRWFWLGPTFAEAIPVGDGELGRPRPARRPAVLPGERVLVSDVLVPFAVVGAELSVDQGAGVDPSLVVDPTVRVPGPRRFGAHPVPLDDGTVVLFGGFDVESGAPATGAFVRRLRPMLDGPDEISTSVATASARYVAHLPGVLPEPGGIVRLPPDPEAADRAPLGVHVRGLRGSRLRLELRPVEVPAGGMRLVHGRSLWDAVVFTLAPGGVTARGVGAGPAPECTSLGGPTAGEPVRLEVRGTTYEILAADRTLAECTVPEPVTGSLGIAGGTAAEIRVGEIKVARLPP